MLHQNTWWKETFLCITLAKFCFCKENSKACSGFFTQEMSDRESTRRGKTYHRMRLQWNLRQRNRPTDAYSLLLIKTKYNLFVELIKSILNPLLTEVIKTKNVNERNLVVDGFLKRKSIFSAEDIVLSTSVWANFFFPRPKRSQADRKRSKAN